MAIPSSKAEAVAADRLMSLAALLEQTGNKSDCSDETNTSAASGFNVDATPVGGEEESAMKADNSRLPAIPAIPTSLHNLAHALNKEKKEGSAKSRRLDQSNIVQKTYDQNLVKSDKFSSTKRRNSSHTVENIPNVASEKNTLAVTRRISTYSSSSEGSGIDANGNLARRNYTDSSKAPSIKKNDLKKNLMTKTRKTEKKPDSEKTKLNNTKRASWRSAPSSVLANKDLEDKSGTQPSKIIAPHRTYFVKHNYRDHACIPLEEVPPVVDSNAPQSQRTNRGGVKSLFPEKLHQVLSLGTDHVDPRVISWALHGRCFSVHNAREFTRELMPKHFNHTAITSFQRQLNLYGFKRITKAGSKDQGAYYHELFLRGRPLLCRRMRRQKIKGTGYKPLPDPDNEPDFYAMPPCYDVVEMDEEKSLLPMQTDNCNDNEPDKVGSQNQATPVGDDIEDNAEGTKRPHTILDDEDEDAEEEDRDVPKKKLKKATTNRKLSCHTKQKQRQEPVSPINSPKQEIADTRQSLEQTVTGSNISKERKNSLLLGGTSHATAQALGMMPTPPTLNTSSLASLQHRQQQVPVSGSARELLLQQLLSQACTADNNAVNAVDKSESVIQNEIKRLEATRQHVMLQEQRLRLLMAQGLASSQQQNSFNLNQLPNTFDNSSSQRPGFLSGLMGRSLNQQVDLGGADLMMSRNSANATNRNNIAALYNALGNLVASGCITQEQLEGIEAVLSR